MNRTALAVEVGALFGVIGTLAPIPDAAAWVIFGAIAVPIGSWLADLVGLAFGEAQR